MSFDKEALFKPRLPEAEVQVPGFDEPFRVRGLSRIEALSIKGMTDTLAIERKMLSLGLLDPRLTEDEVGQWQQAATATELDPVTEKVMELSGVLPASAKEAFKDFEADPGSEFRILPGAGAVDDGGATPGGTE